jgi:hypothetical protein
MLVLVTLSVSIVTYAHVAAPTRPEDFKVKGIPVPADDVSDPPARERWWERFSPVQGVLLNPQQTPWSISAYERYEQMKPTR